MQRERETGRRQGQSLHDRRSFMRGSAAAMTVVAVDGATRVTAAAEVPVRIGVLNDQSGLYADIEGHGSAIAAQMALEDHGGSVLGRPIEILVGDHQNKPDVGATIVRRWLDTDGVTLVSEQRPDGFEYWKTGFTHLCFTDPEVDRLVDRVVAHGGRRRSATWSPWEDPSKALALCEDPFGNVLEIYSHSSEQMVSNVHEG